MTDLAAAIARLNNGDAAGAERLALDLMERDESGAAAFVAGVAAQAQGQRADARDRFEHAVSRGYSDGDVWRRLGACRAHLGDFTGARDALLQAAELAPGDARILNNLAVIEIRLGRTGEAAVNCRKALGIAPDYPAALNNLGIALQHDGALAEAEALHRRAIDLDPGLADAWANLGVALRGQSRYGEAVAAFSRSIELKPGASSLWSNRLLCLQYDPDREPEEVFAAHLAFGRAFGAGTPVPAAPPLEIEPGYRAGRPLRIGYVSADFRSHSVAFFLEPLLGAHDPAAVETFCYSDVAAPDRVTARLRELTANWRDTAGLDDRALAALVQRDRVDVLIDLAGHTAGNRLAMFALKPAPVQATWLGYPGTTGLAEIDYRLTDAISDPDDEFHAERPVRLPHGLHCYLPPVDAPVPTRVPGRPPTFGSFNNLSKVTPAVMAAWSRLTASVPGAQLLLKSRPLADAEVRARYLAIAAEAGLAPDRVRLVGHVPDLAAHLALYSEVDVALDPFPYAGTTTTCEALWMGVPVVTVRGDTHAGRVGASLLTHAGLEELIAGDPGEAVPIARDLVGDSGRLDRYRAELRGRLAASPICDAPAFARAFEDALHCMWRARGTTG
jgi:predicted O-linked N-acetylglucosamine transferase (SPINDLY family)